MAQCQIKKPVDHCKEVLKCYNQCVDKLSENDLTVMLKKGVLVNGNMMITADAKLSITVEVFARALSIIWGNSCEYWTYIRETPCSPEVAKLLRVCWLDVQGKVDANILAPCTEYEVVYNIKMTSCASGWDKPVNFTLTPPNGCPIKTEKCMKQYIGKCEYQEINIGKFKTASHASCGSTVAFTLQEHGGHWKSGLIVKSVTVRPVKCGC